MSISANVEQLRQHRLIPVIRAQSAEDALWGATHLIEAGFRLMEITYSTPQTPHVIASLRQAFPAVLVGAGTVTTVEQATEAIQAGAGFLASPALQQEVLRYAVAHNVLMLPGTLTPSEMLQARNWGTTLLKLFPAASAGGPAYLKSILAPLPDLQIVPTGGIHLDNFTDYLAAGALAVGLGNHLVPPDVLALRNESELHQRASAYLERLNCHQVAGERL